LDNGEKANGSQADTLKPQPSGQQLNQQIKRQTRGKTGCHTYEHAPVEQLLPERLTNYVS
jgi:hypothetical protein